MKATQGHRATPDAGFDITPSLVADKLKVQWSWSVAPTSWDCRLIDTTLGQVQQTSIAGGLNEITFSLALTDGHTYRGEVRPMSGGEPGAWLVSTGLLYNA